MSAGLYAGVVLAGSLGSGARFIVDGEITRRHDGGGALGTLTVNVVGSLLLGLLTGAVLHLGAPQDLQVVLGTGFCGGFTTFGTAAVEVVRLLERGSPLAAVVDAAANLGLCLLAAGVGLAVTT